MMMMMMMRNVGLNSCCSNYYIPFHLFKPHPRRPRGSWSGRDEAKTGKNRRRDKSFQERQTFVARPTFARFIISFVPRLLTAPGSPRMLKPLKLELMEPYSKKPFSMSKPVFPVHTQRETGMSLVNSNPCTVMIRRKWVLL